MFRVKCWSCCPNPFLWAWKIENWQVQLLLPVGQPREIIHEGATLGCYRNISLSEVISVIGGLLGVGPKMMIPAIESFAFGAASIVSGTSDIHRVMSLVLCSDLAQSPMARYRHSHSVSCVTFMFSRSVCIEAAISFHPGKCVWVALKLTQSTP